MEIFKQKTQINFVGPAMKVMPVSTFLMLVSIVLFFTRGFNFGIEFAGGSEALVAFSEPMDVGQLRETADAIGLDQVEVVRFGVNDEGRYFFRTRTRSLLTQAETDKVRTAITDKVAAPEMWDTSDETGEQIRVKFAEGKDTTALQTAVREAGYPSAEVTRESGGANPVYVLRMPSIGERLSSALKEKFGDKFKTVERLESVGSVVGKQLTQQGVLALLYAVAGIVLYVIFRFDLRFGPGALFSLAHDAIITAGIWSALWLEFDLQIVAALLAILGYSVNDTVVIYDRIREKEREVVGKTLQENINSALNDTLSRTLITSGVALISVFAIMIFGGALTRGFAVAMAIGMFSGVYSTIYIAVPFTLIVDRYLAKKKAETGGAKATTAGASRP